MSEYGFSEYNLARRSISFLQPLIMIGLGVAVPRYTSMYPQRNSILPTGFFLLVLSALFFSSIIVGLKEYFATLFFGEESYSPFIFPLLLLLLGYCFHSILFGFLRGKHNVYFANGIQLLNLGFIPIAVLLYTSDVLSLLYITSILLLFACLSISVILVFKYSFNLNKIRILVDSKTLLNYGLPRVLGDFALLALITSPTYIILSFQDNTLIGGDVAYSITLLNLVGAAFAPLGLVILPEVASFLTARNYTMIKSRFKLFIVVSLALTFLGYLLFYFFSDFILSILLGDDYRENIINVSLIVLSGSFGYGLYIILRSFLDAIKVQATNAINLIITLILFALLIFYCYTNNFGTNEILIVFALCMNFLGLLTLVQTYYAVKRL
jgi:O-antigen/teichoic acid export membrane protein